MRSFSLFDRVREGFDNDPDEVKRLDTAVQAVEPEARSGGGLKAMDHE